MARSASARRRRSPLIKHLQERDCIADQLAAAIGLGGRNRKAGSQAERARSAVTKRIKDSIDKIAEAMPPLGRHLIGSIKTGYFCSYIPYCMRLTTKIIINNQRILRKSYEELAEVDVTTLNDHDLEEYRKVADEIRRYRFDLGIASFSGYRRSGNGDPEEDRCAQSATSPLRRALPFAGYRSI
jgi:hypothetical protein